MSILLKNGSVADQFTSKIEKKDILIQNGTITMIGTDLSVPGVSVIDLTDKVIVPGLVDIHVHLRDPGLTHKEDIITGSNSAAAGGFTTVVCMPNTRPAIDNVETVKYIQDKAEKYAPVKVLIAGAITKGLEGKELTDMEALAEAGVSCFSDDGQCVMNAEIMRSALLKSCKQGLTVFPHCEDKNLSQRGIMNDGLVAKELGLPGIPSTAEEIMVARDIILAKATGAKLHITHLSTAGSLELVRIAKDKGLEVTCDVTPHNIFLTEETVRYEKTNAIMYPPLRTTKDINALIEGLKDGTVDAIATDHAPHSEEEKSNGFETAPKGVIGLETSLAVCLEALVHSGILTLPELIRKMSYNPSRIIGLKPSEISVGSTADITIIDLGYKWKVDRNGFMSKSKNTPFNGLDLRGKPVMTISGGKVVFKAKDCCI